MTKRWTLAALALGVAGAGHAQQAPGALPANAALVPPGAEGEFPNPVLLQEGGGPCVVLNDYDANPTRGTDGPVFRAVANLENVCARAMEVRFCFRYVGASEDGGPLPSNCYQGAARPFERFVVEDPDAPGRHADSSLEWRYLPYTP